MIIKSLRTIGLATRYRSDRNDVIRDFYSPAYNVALDYSRAVGYFTSTSIALLSRGINAFTDRGGKIRIVASPKLSLEDLTDLERGYQVREIIKRATIRTLSNELHPGILRGLGVIGKLIAGGNLDIRIAFLAKGNKIGLYHEKIGYFRDSLGNIIAFTGSANETYGGLFLNFESVEVYRGWDPSDRKRALDIVSDFDNLWSDDTPGLKVIEFPEITKERLLEFANEHGSAQIPARENALFDVPKSSEIPNSFRVPMNLVSRPYQIEAIKAWLKNRGNGILKMATGTGKTKTALSAAAHIYQVHLRSDQSLVIVVVAPYMHLVDQWIEEISEFGVNPIAVYESSQKWIPHVEDMLAAMKYGHETLMVIVTTNRSFALESFQNILRRIDKPFLLIADEVHNLGSSFYRKSLPSNAIYRLGLSATPERYMDPVGTEALLNYFGPIAYLMDLEAAINAGALCHYRYYPRLVELNDQEMALYTSLTAQIAPLLDKQESLDDVADDSPLGLLLRKRSGVLGHAAGKLSSLKRDLDSHRNDWFQLVYCAEGRRPTADAEDPPGDRQIEDVLSLIGRVMKLSIHSYVSDTLRENRRALLRRFETGCDLRFLVAMRCLDEGVDIPDARVAYLLASSTNPRQFIQRRGRLLRNAPGKKGAIIYDYLAVPRSRGGGANSETERNLVHRELDRAVEFGKLSDNYQDTLKVLRPLKKQFGLTDL